MDSISIENLLSIEEAAGIFISANMSCVDVRCNVCNVCSIYCNYMECKYVPKSQISFIVDN